MKPRNEIAGSPSLVPWAAMEALLGWFVALVVKELEPALDRIHVRHLDRAAAIGMMVPGKYYTIGDLADIYGVHTRTIRRWIKEGILPGGVRLDDRDESPLRWSRAQIDRNFRDRESGTFLPTSNAESGTAVPRPVSTVRRVQKARRRRAE